MPTGIPKSGANKGWFKSGTTSPWKGKKRPELATDKHPNWNGGKPKCWCGKQLKSYKAKNCMEHAFSPERVKKIRNGRRAVVGTNHPNWRGEKVGYRGIHLWLVRNYGQPSECERCPTMGFGHSMHWANISGQYLRDRADWMRLCPKCHGEYDKSKRTQI